MIHSAPGVPGTASLPAGLTLLGFGTYEAMVQHRLQREGIRVRGLVVRHYTDGPRMDGPPVHFAVVEFDDAQGGRHTFQARSSGVKGLPVGGGVPVRYLPEAPQGARIDLLRRRIAEVALLLAGGILFTAIGIWTLATGR
ncbi:DUF3592 domain-containing protein [Streptomyces sp. NPDC058412]|uniref:DUF3592 domain-containing protein n=1 Tax=Streptomyces sp. NPDC058412 TaxID=3346486 RepID=UPI0036575081